VWQNGLQPGLSHLGQQIWAALEESPLGNVLENIQRDAWPILEQGWKDGCVIGLQLVDAKELRVQLTVVFLRQAQQEAHFTALLRQLAKSNQWPLTALQLSGRRIQQVQIPDAQWRISWWPEAEHLVLLVGTEPPQATLEVLEGKRPSVLQNEWYKRVAAGPGYASCLRGYLYSKPLVEALQGSGPTGKKVAALSGLEQIPAISWHLGAEGRAVRSTLHVHLSRGPRQGLAALFPDTRAGIEGYFQGKQALPPLTPGAEVQVYQLDLQGLGKPLRQTIEALADALGPEEAKRIREQVTEFLQAPGMDIVQDLLPHLGSVCFTSEAMADGLLFSGMMQGIQVKNVPAARKVLARLKTLQIGDLTLRFQRRQYRGHELICAHFGENGGVPIPFIPTLAIVDDWLLMALFPQPIQGVILRREFQGWARWKPSPESQKILGSLQLNEERRLVGFRESDPRGTVEFIGSVLPFIGGLVNAYAPGSFDPTWIPPTQALTEPLFPNVTIYLAEPDGLRVESYDSLPTLGSVDLFLGIIVPLLMQWGVDI
jgi:hypothetical protein